jgi:metal-sulfur cluster biosynthetic enzyme
MATEAQVLDLLRSVIDPDVGIDVVDLGLVETLDITPDGIRVGLIMTTPACPQTEYLREEATLALASLGKVAVSVLDAPLWKPERMKAGARAVLGWQ